MRKIYEKKKGANCKDNNTCVLWREEEKGINREERKKWRNKRKKEENRGPNVNKRESGGDEEK